MQGGGAMGAYHIGAFQALQEHAFEPDWVCGISIGAINGTIIVGNAPGRQLDRLKAFWNTILRPSIMLSFAEAPTLGQPGFFSPRPMSPFLASASVAATSFYDTAPLYDTLAGVVDFASLGKVGTRLSVDATDVETGALQSFDTHQMPGRFGVEHVVASSSLPPGSPATTIGGRQYWDGGCVSNTPLQAVLDNIPITDAVVFVINLWSASGPASATLAAVEWRSKQIRYAGSTFSHVHAVAAKFKLRAAQRMLNEPGSSPPGLGVDIVHIIYHPGEDQIPASDAEFSRASIVTRRAAGLSDMRRALAERPWRRPERSEHFGCLIHKVTPEGVTTIEDE